MTFKHAPMFPLGADQTPYRKLTSEGVKVETFNGQEVLSVSTEALRLLAETAMIDINHLLRPGHLAQLAKILDDPEATGNDRFVSPLAACCRCARTPAPRSSWARRGA